MCTVNTEQMYISRAIQSTIFRRFSIYTYFIQTTVTLKVKGSKISTSKLSSPIHEHSLAMTS